MSVEIETSALSMFESLDSLRSTPLVMHRIQVELRDIATWLAVKLAVTVRIAPNK